MKKLVLLFFLFILSMPVFANIEEAVVQNIPESEKNFDLDSKIKKELKDSITDVYGSKNSAEIYEKVISIAKKAVDERPAELLKEDFERPSDWYKNEIIYMFYVDQFGVVKDDSKNTFKDTALMFDYLQDLGVTTLYMLPFAESPMKDAGFDVKNPQDVRRDLGGMAEFKDFIKEAKKRGFKIKSDLVLNHFSEDCEWFKKLVAGDEKYLDYFIVREDEPEYLKYQDEKLGTVIEYKEADGKISKRRLIFPENVENNWRKVSINGKDYWFYHTFYPFQLDINWENPDVLYYVLETISGWANLGVDIFRMDAIPYLSKEPGTNAENRPKTHAIIRLLSNYIQLTAPASVIQVEACQTPKDILPYFGKEREIDLKIVDKKKTLKRTDEAQIAYHFPWMPAIWASLVTEDKKYFTESVKNTPDIPKSASWGVFLRVHDELTLEMVSPAVREIVFDDLVTKGASFRKGFGVSGRLANFLDKNPDRIETAFSILLSIPGIPIIYYGDEAGVANNFENAKKSALLRSKDVDTNKNTAEEKEGAIKNAVKIKTTEPKAPKRRSNLLSAFDSRDIHRGNVPKKLFYGSKQGYYEFNSKVYKKVKNLIALRKSLPVMTDGSFEILKTKSKSNFAYIRKNKDKRILVINNLSKEKLIAEVSLPADIILKNNNHITSLKNLVNGDNIKVNISLQNRTMHLRVAPYQVLWLEL